MESSKGLNTNVKEILLNLQSIFSSAELEENIYFIKHY